jgi:hypothetical protein
VRTTVDIPDDLYRRLKAKAALDGTTVKQTIVRLVAQEIPGPPDRGRCRFPVIKGKESRRLNLTNREIDEILFG